MAWGREQYKDLARQQADAEDSPRWTPEYVNAFFALTFDSGWRRLLNADPIYRYSKLTASVSSDGTIPIATLSAMITPNRIHRFLDQRTVRDKKLSTLNNIVYEPVTQGTNVYFGTGAVGQIPVWLSHMPQNPETFTGATADTDDVDWPDGFELVLVNHLAANLLTKGAVETGASSDLFALLDAMYTDMLQNLMRRTTKNPSFAPSDNASDWSAGMNW